jgi:cell volume regulation protein A
MNFAIVFGLPAALLILAFAANRFAKLSRVPDVIVLLLIGILLGPGLHWVHPDKFEGVIHVLGTLALMLILFEGGLELQLRQAMRYFPAGALLALVSYGLSFYLIALMSKALLHLPWNDCLLVGAALGCTSGSVVIPALQQIIAPESVKITLTVEASLGEVLAVIMVDSLVSIAGDQSMVTGLAGAFSHHILVAALLGFGAGFLWSHLWPRIAGQPYTNIVNLGVVLGVYAAGVYLGGSGLLTVLIFGVTLANMPRTPHMMRQGARMAAFHAELSFLVRSFFFVLLGVVAQFASRKYIIPILGILAAVLLSRFLAVQVSRWAVRDATRKETELLFWMLPRGLVTAVLALEIVEAKGEAFSFLPALAFTILLASNLFVIWGAFQAGKAEPEAKSEPLPIPAPELKAALPEAQPPASA